MRTSCAGGKGVGFAGMTAKHAMPRICTNEVVSFVRPVLCQSGLHEDIANVVPAQDLMEINHLRKARCRSSGVLRQMGVAARPVLRHPPKFLVGFSSNPLGVF
jgi:hypothetical protein